MDEKAEYIKYIDNVLNELDLRWVKCVYYFALRFTREKEAAQS